MALIKLQGLGGRDIFVERVEVAAVYGVAAGVTSVVLKSGHAIEVANDAASVLLQLRDNRSY